MKHFTIKELTKSNMAESYKINNEPNEYVIDNMKKLIDNVLDPLREAFGSPIYINSGYRCKELNDKVKGSKTSDHLKGCAVDIRGRDNAMLYNLILHLKLPFKQLIWEKGNDKQPDWVHVSYEEGNNKNQVLRIK